MAATISPRWSEVAVTRVDATKPAVSESIPRQITTPGDRSWTGRAERWARFTVPVAYDLRYDTYVRPVMGGEPGQPQSGSCRR